MIKKILERSKIVAKKVGYPFEITMDDIVFCCAVGVSILMWLLTIPVGMFIFKWTLIYSFGAGILSFLFTLALCYWIEWTCD